MDDIRDIAKNLMQQSDEIKQMLGFSKHPITLEGKEWPRC